MYMQEYTIDLSIRISSSVQVNVLRIIVNKTRRHCHSWLAGQYVFTLQLLNGFKLPPRTELRNQYELYTY